MGRRPGSRVHKPRIGGDCRARDRLLGWAEPDHASARREGLGAEDSLECVTDSVEAACCAWKPLRGDENDAGVWDRKRGEAGKVADVLGDNAATVAGRPGQYLVVGTGGQPDLYVEYGQHVVTGIAQALRERRRVHLIEKDYGYDFRRRRLCWAVHSRSSRSATSVLLAILSSISSG